MKNHIEITGIITGYIDMTNFNAAGLTIEMIDGCIAELRRNTNTNNSEEGEFK